MVVRVKMWLCEVIISKLHWWVLSLFVGSKPLCRFWLLSVFWWEAIRKDFQYCWWYVVIVCEPQCVVKSVFEKMMCWIVWWSILMSSLHSTSLNIACWVSLLMFSLVCLSCHTQQNVSRLSFLVENWSVIVGVMFSSGQSKGHSCAAVRSLF